MSGRARIAAAMVMLAAAGAGAGASGAQAFYGNGAGGHGALVASASVQRQEQGDDRTTQVAISRDGRYAVFETRAGNLFADDDPDPVLAGPGGAPVPTDRQGGIFRRDLSTGEIAKVADGDVVAESNRELLIGGARNPSVSADGRYVAFSTGQSLVPQDPTSPRHTDVYVRDMAASECRPLPGCAGNPYTLVSAVNGTSSPLTYAPSPIALPSGAPGSDVWPGTSISADGRRVALRTLELASDAPGPPLTVAGTPSTPGFQLLMRDLDSRETQLQTRRRADGLPAGGAIGPATISGSGAVVAWAGGNAQVQTPFLQGEPTAVRANYYLYRRAETSAPTRRITGFVDPEDPGCPPDSTVVRDSTSQGPCYGPLTDQEEVAGNISASPVALSHDGLEVAFLTSQSRRGAQTGLPGLDLFTTTMAAGTPRKFTTVELTREAIGDDAASRAIDSVAMSADGRLLAVTTRRVRFLLDTLRPEGVFRALPLTRELYVIDRAQRTIERAAQSSDGRDPGADIDVGTSLTGDGSRIAFTSAASNLFFGDANERADAFVVFSQAEPVEEEPPPEAPPAEPVVEESSTQEIERPRLSVRALSVTSTGRLRLEVRAPAAGGVTARARGRLPDRDGRRRASTPIRQMARAGTRTRRAQTVRMELRLSRSTTTLLQRVRRLPASAQVTFTPLAGGTAEALSRTLRITFTVARPSARNRR